MSRAKVVLARRGYAALIPLIPLGLLACGREPEPPRLALEVAPEQPATVQPAGGLPPRTVTPDRTRVPTLEEAELAYRAGQFGEARTLLVRYTAANPHQVTGNYLLGLAAWKSGDLPGAETALRRVLEEDSTHLKAHLNLARVLMDQGRDREAIERASAVLDLDSTSAEGLRLLARAQHRLGDREAALDTYRHALVLDDRDVWAVNNLGVLYLEDGEPESALPPLARAVELRGTAPVFQTNLGTALEKAGFLAAARDAYQAAVKADPTYARARSGLARTSRTIEMSGEPPAAVNLRELADLFRLHVQMWRETAERSTATPPEEPLPADTMPPVPTDSIPPAGDPA